MVQPPNLSPCSLVIYQAVRFKEVSQGIALFDPSSRIFCSPYMLYLVNHVNLETSDDDDVSALRQARW